MPDARAVITAEEQIVEMYSSGEQIKATPITGHVALDRHGFQRVPCYDVGGVAVYDGDIVLGTTQHMHEAEAIAADHGIQHFNPVPLKQAPEALAKKVKVTGLWPERKVYYQFVSLSSEWQEPVRQAIKFWISTGIFQFVELTKKEPPGNSNCIRFVSDESGCWASSIGMSPPGTPLTVNLMKLTPEIVAAKGARMMGTAMHEIGHTLGLFHEQRRRDSHSYLEVLWQHIKQGEMSQFTQIANGHDLGRYDYASIMQYPDWGFAKAKGMKTMAPYDRNAQMGQRVGLSIQDINAVTSIYTERVSQITVEAETGDSPGEGAFYLGIGGREFSLGGPQTTFDAGSKNRWVFGEKSENVAHQDTNDPRSPGLVIPNVMGFPVYIRGEAAHQWALNHARVTVRAHEIHHEGASDLLIHFDLGSREKLMLRHESSPIVFLDRERSSGIENVYRPGDLYLRQIVVQTTTGDTRTDGLAYLGLAGREFALQTTDDDYRQNHAAVFRLGQGSNIQSSSMNDPRQPALKLDDLHRFPMYIRGEVDEWKIDYGSVTVTVQDSEGKPTGHPLKLDTILSHLKMGRDCGLACHLKYHGAPGRRRPTTEALFVQSITAELVSGSGADGAGVYLGIGGREFKLDGEVDLRADKSSIVQLGGAAANAPNPQDNDPNYPEVTQLDVETFPAYLRASSDGWVQKSAKITVNYENAGGTQAGTDVFRSVLDSLCLSKDSGFVSYLMRESAGFGVG